ncbi:phosphate acyltransferase PlsX [Aliidiomarina celeris]|uniref:phosphate acyltransferase PlsX n=1 Tax=Aliidiomarina celeris TaxID=2249428 RepID=UPI000DE9E29E|nr:phosphate acyltransferase PlsX [Aliidiomarina celeris]
MSSLTIALDTMGGDRGPSIVVAALERALQSFPTINFLLFGDQAELLPLLKKHQLLKHPRIQLEHTNEVIEMTDKPGQCIRSKPKASMRLAVESVAEERAQACVSAGNTGALMALSYLKLKTIAGVIRPALVAPLPNQDESQSLLLDLGANPSCDAETLFQFGVMGSVLAEEIGGKVNPRVALLNMGVEEIKGHDTVRQAAALLKASSHVNYIGFVEGNDIFSGKADVIVCDGFSGNVALKSCEGMAKLLYDNFERTFKGHWFSRLLAWVLYKRFKKSWQWLNPDQYNGATLLGLRGVVVKSHGNASAQGFYSAIRQAVREAQEHLPSRVHNRIESALIEHD